MLNLTVASGPDKGRVFSLLANETRVIGRGEGPRLLSDRTASRQHAQFSSRNGQWYLSDLGSTNGTFVNGQRITQETLIADGDQVQIGCTLLVANTITHDEATIAGNVALIRHKPMQFQEDPEQDPRHETVPYQLSASGHPAANDPASGLAVLDRPDSPRHLAPYQPVQPSYPVAPAPQQQQPVSILGWILVLITMGAIFFLIFDMHFTHKHQTDELLKQIQQNQESMKSVFSRTSGPSAEPSQELKTLSQQLIAYIDKTNESIQAVHSLSSEQTSDKQETTALLREIRDSLHNPRQTDTDDQLAEKISAALASIKAEQVNQNEQLIQQIQAAVDAAQAKVPPASPPTPPPVSAPAAPPEVAPVVAATDPQLAQLLTQILTELRTQRVQVEPRQIPTATRIAAAPSPETSQQSLVPMEIVENTPSATDTRSLSVARAPIKAAPQATKYDGLQPDMPSQQPTALVSQPMLPSALAQPTQPPGTTRAAQPSQADKRPPAPALQSPDSAGAVALLNTRAPDNTQGFGELVAINPPAPSRSTVHPASGAASGAAFGATSGSGAASGAASEVTSGGFGGSGGISEGEPRRVVYLIDASGSLIDSMPRVINELNRSIDQLNPNQLFSVIFFQHDQAIEVPPVGLKQATVKTKDRIEAWINPSTGHIAPSGSSNPLQALTLAATYNPDTIYIFSDTITGNGPGEISHDELLEAIGNLNPDHRIGINTVQFFYRDAQNTLKTVAERFGGSFSFIEESKPLPPMSDSISPELLKGGQANLPSTDEMIERLLNEPYTE